MSWREIIDSLRLLWRVPPTTTVGVVTAAQGVRAVKVTPGRGQDDNFSTLTLAPVPSLSDGTDAASALGDGEMIFAIPQNLALVKRLRVPSGSAAEIGAMVKLQALRQLPFSLNEVILDYEVIARDAEFAGVMVLTVRQDALRAQLALLERYGCRPTRVILSGQALWALMKRRRTPEALLAICLEAGEALFVAGRGRLIEVMRTVVLQGTDVSDIAAQVRQALLQTMEVFQGSEPAEAMGGICYLGFGDLEQKIYEDLQVHWGARMGRYGDLAGEPAPGPAGSLLAFGAVLAADETSADFMPLDLKARQRRAQWKKELRVFATTAALLALLAALSLCQKMYQIRSEEKRLAHELSILEPQTQGLRRQMAELRRAASSRKTTGLTGVLRTLQTYTPARIVFDQISFDQGEVTIQASAKSLQDALAWVKALQTSERFATVEMRSSAARAGVLRDAVSFQVTCRLQPSAAEKS